MSKKHRGGRSLSLTRSSHLVSASASSSTTSSVADVPEGAVPPPHAGHSGTGGGHSERDSSHLPGPSGLGVGSRSSPMAGPSCSGDGGRSSPSPLGVGDDDCPSTADSLGLDRDDSFRAVLRLIREFHNLEELASVVPNRCKTSLAPVFGLQSESSPDLRLPTSPILRSLREDTNLALAKFVEDQTVHGFLPVPGWRY